MLLSPSWQMGYTAILMKVSCWLLLSGFFYLALFPQSKLHVMQCSGSASYYQTVAEKELNTLKIWGWCVWLEFPLWKALCICVVGMTKAQSILCMQAYKLLHRPCLEREENFIITWILCFPLAQLPVFPIDYYTLQPWKCTVRLTERRKFCSELEIGGKLRILEVPICLCPTPILLLCRICSEMTSLFPTVDQPSDEHCWPWLEWLFSM